MQDDSRETAARRAIDAGDWQTARELFETLTRETNTPEAWAGLAEAAWLQQDSRLMIDARLTAYRLHRERGNDVAAARMAIALGNDFLDFRGDAKVANGWPDELDDFVRRKFAAWDRESLGDLRRPIQRRRRELAG